MRWQPKPSMSNPSKGPSVAVTDERFEHIQAFFDTPVVNSPSVKSRRSVVRLWPPSAKRFALLWYVGKRKA